MRCGQEHMSQIRQPVRVWVGIIIGVRDNLSRGSMHSSISRIAQPLVGGIDDAEGIFSDYGFSVIG